MYRQSVPVERAIKKKTTNTRILVNVQYAIMPTGIMGSDGLSLLS